MLRIRLLDRDDANHGQISYDLTFTGIRNEEKLKTFLMSDLITFYVYKQLSENYFSNKSEENENKHLVEVTRISKLISLHYAGNPSGTPADQLAKRVENLIHVLRKEHPKHSDVAVSINPDNIRYYHDFFDPKSDGEQIAVRVNLPNSTLIDTIREECGYSGGVPGYLAMSDLSRWIIREILEKARNDISLQSIMKVQHDVMRDLFSDKLDIPESIKFNILRMYISIRCILHDHLDNIGDVYEPVFSYSSFTEIFPTFKIPPKTDNLVIMSSVGSDEILDKIRLDNVFTTVEKCSGPIDSWDQELMLYKARLLFEYKSYNLLIIDDNYDSSWIENIFKSIQNMKWIPRHITIVGDCKISNKGPTEISVISNEGRDAHEIAADIVSMYTIGIRSNDRYAEAIIRTTYLDVLTPAYPELGPVINSFEKRVSSVELMIHLKKYLESHMAMKKTRNDTLVSALVYYLTNLRVINE